MLRHLLAAASATLAAWAPGGAGAADAGLDELEALLNEPVYAASRFAQTAAEAPAAVTVLTAGDIRTYGWRTLAELLAAVRGVHIRNDRVYDYIGVRGISRPGDYSSRVLLQIDGLRINENVYDSLLIGREFPLDVSMIERVEFIPGPGSALYGSNAVLGVINVVTRRTASVPGLELGLAAGSGDTRKLRASYARDGRDGALLIAASAENRPGTVQRFDGIGDVPAAHDAERDRKFYLRWSGGGWSFTALHSDRFKRVPTGWYGASTSDPRNDSRDQLDLVGAAYERPLGETDTLHAQLDLAHYRYDSNFAYDDGSGDATYARGRWWHAELRWTTRRFAAHQLVVGAELQRDLRQERGYFLTRPAYELVDLAVASGRRIGVFVNDEWTLAPDWRVALGARADRQPDGTWTTMPRLALIWQALPALRLKALGGSAYREPNTNEAMAADNVSLANPDLTRERVGTRELVLDWRASEALRLSASVYDTHVRNLIELVFDEATGFYQYRNVGRLHARGAEWEADLAPGGGVRLRTSWSLQRVRNEAGETVGNAPRSLAKLNASAPLPGTPVRLGLEWQRTGLRRTMASATLPAQSVVNLTAGIDPPGARWQAALSVYNLADRRQRDPSGPEHAFDSLAHGGRSLELRIGLRH